MLKLNKQITLSKEQKDLIKSLGTLNKNSWDKNPTKLKGAITEKLRKKQGNRCAYCDCKIEGTPDVDHIAHKASYPQFSFEPRNLVLTCSFCNEKLKGDVDTIDKLSSYYKSCEFKMIHPYFDDVDHYFDCSKPIIIIKSGLTSDENIKAKWTWSHLKFEDSRFCEKRARQGIINRECKALGKTYEELVKEAMIEPMTW